MAANGQPKPHEVTLQVPDNVGRDFRAALVGEIAWDSDAIRKEREALDNGVHYRELESTLDDIQSQTQSLSADIALAAQVDLNGGGQFELRGDPGDLAHVCEHLAAHVLRPRLENVLLVAPYERDTATEARELTDRLTWAIDRAVELRGGRKPNRIRELRGLRGMTQAQLADCLGVPSTRVARMERGEEPIGPDHLEVMVELFGTSVDWLLGTET